MQQERDPKIIEEFNRRRKRQLILAVGLIGGLMWLTAVIERSAQISNKTQGAVVVAIVLGAVAYSFKNWRCPACNKYLGKSVFLAFCPLCGVPLK